MLVEGRPGPSLLVSAPIAHMMDTCHRTIVRFHFNHLDLISPQVIGHARQRAQWIAQPLVVRQGGRSHESTTHWQSDTKASSVERACLKNN